jgi:predicted amino acid dehydrogenase
MREHQPTTTVAIVGANTVVESALAQFLEGEGYSIRHLKLLLHDHRGGAA